MTETQVALTIQAASASITAIAVVVALIVGAIDRRAALRQAQLQVEFDWLLTLSENLARGGSSDSSESKRMGAEALAIIAMAGPERVPRMWARKVERSVAELRAFVDKPDEPQWLRDSVEASVAVRQLVEEMDRSRAKRAKKARSAEGAPPVDR